MQINRFAIALFLSSASTASAAEVTTAKKAPRKLSKKNNGNSNSNSNASNGLSADQKETILRLHNTVSHDQVMKGYQYFRSIQKRRVLAEDKSNPAFKIVGKIMKALGESDPKDLFDVVDDDLINPCPKVRWTPYDKLTQEQLEYVTDLEYTEATWNELGTNSIEGFDFDSLSDEEKTAATQLGFDEDSWNCEQNHFNDYTWQELKDNALDTYLTTLGWNERKWKLPLFVPESEDKFWSELTSAEQDAASKICYFQQSWDGIPLLDWTPCGANPNERGEISWNVVGTVLGCLGSIVSSAIACSGFEATDEDSCKDYQDVCTLAVDGAVGVCARPKSLGYNKGLGVGYWNLN